MTSFWPPGTSTSLASSSDRRPSRWNTSRIMRRSSGTQSRMRRSPPVTPANAMNDAISMWSGETVCSHPPGRSSPWTCITLEPTPSIAAPMRMSMRARSCTCGSDAAFRITLVPGVSAAAMRAFSVPITDGSSMKKSHACRPRSGATRRMSRSYSIRAPSARKASRCGSSRRRPITSPPGGGIIASPKRGSSGPATRKDARIRSARVGSTSVLRTPSAHSATALSCCSTVTPRSSRRTSIASVSRMRGMLWRTISSSVSRQAASSGRAAFLLPAGTTVPDSGTPPSMTNFSMSGGSWAGGTSSGTRARRRRWARVTAMSEALSRPDAWSLFCEWTESASLRKHVLAVEAAMRAYARRFGEDEALWGITGLLHDLDYERHPDLETGHPRVALRELEARSYPPALVRAVASHADFLGVSRDSRMEKTLYAVDELSGFLMACAYVRPQGIHGLTAKSVKKKMKQPSFAAAVNREELRAGAEDLGVDFDEHVAFVIAALEEEADALELHGSEAAPAG